MGIYKDNQLLGDYVVSLGTFEQTSRSSCELDRGPDEDGPGVPPAQAKAAIASVTKEFPNVRIQDQAQFRQNQADR